MHPDRRVDMIPAPVVIGRQVWLGAAVTVVPGATIGDCAIVAGVPARLIRMTGFDASPS
jgi:acetyltransferase-like isoleucine patch superfamily enzyme